LTKNNRALRIRRRAGQPLAAEFNSGVWSFLSKFVCSDVLKLTFALFSMLTQIVEFFEI
jgi:hypothetical protein